MNPRPLECKSSALPTELQPQLTNLISFNKYAHLDYPLVFNDSYRNFFLLPHLNLNIIKQPNKKCKNKNIQIQSFIISINNTNETINPLFH